MKKTIQLINGKIIETTTEIVEHDPQTLLNDYQAKLEETVKGRDNYLEEVNARIESLQNQIEIIENILK